jgi:hypothetical protein
MPFLADGVASGGYLLFGVFAASEHLGSKDWPISINHHDV